MDEAEERDDLMRLEKLMMPFVDNAALWPVGFAVFGHVALLAAIAILFAVRSGSPPGIASLAILGALTLLLGAREVRRKGRPGGIALILTLTWSGAALVAWAADRSGAF